MESLLALLCILDVSVLWLPALRLHLSAEVGSAAPPGLWTCDLPRQRLQPTGPIATPTDPPGLLPTRPFPSPSPHPPTHLLPASLLPLKNTLDFSSSSEGLLPILLISRDSFLSVWQRFFFSFFFFFFGFPNTSHKKWWRVSVSTQSMHTALQTSGCVTFAQLFLGKGRVVQSHCCDLWICDPMI